MTQRGTEPTEVLAEQYRREGETEWPSGVAESGEAAEQEPTPRPETYLPQARSLLTELHPSGFGELLVTAVWLPPGAGEQSSGPSEETDRRRGWEARQEMRQLGLLREKPAFTYDARAEQYWTQVREAQQSAPQAIVDPYTDLVAAFGDADPRRIAEYRREAREYGRRAEGLLAAGRAYMVAGRLKSAQSAFRAATKADPLHPQAWWHLGAANLFVRANDAAARALERAAEQLPGDFRAGLALGLARYHLKQYAAAEERLRRVAGSSGLRASARSLLACSLRMQQKWEEARAELGFLRQNPSADWAGVADQCLDCVARGEDRAEGPRRRRYRTAQMLKSLAAAAAGAVWVAYSLAEDLFRKGPKWAIAPLFVLVLVLARALRGFSGRELPGQFGNAEQGLPCWQATTWTRPRRAEL